MAETAFSQTEGRQYVSVRSTHGLGMFTVDGTFQILSSNEVDMTPVFMQPAPSPAN